MPPQLIQYFALNQVSLNRDNQDATIGRRASIDLAICAIQQGVMNNFQPNCYSRKNHKRNESAFHTIHTIHLECSTTYPERGATTLVPVKKSHATTPPTNVAAAPSAANPSSTEKE